MITLQLTHAELKVITQMIHEAASNLDYLMGTLKVESPYGNYTMPDRLHGAAWRLLDSIPTQQSN